MTRRRSNWIYDVREIYWYAAAFVPNFWSRGNSSQWDCVRDNSDRRFFTPIMKAPDVTLGFVTQVAALAMGIYSRLTLENEDISHHIMRPIRAIHMYSSSLHLLSRTPIQIERSFFFTVFNGFGGLARRVTASD